MKVLILYNKLFHYRIPVWNILASYCDLTVAYSEGDGRIPEKMSCCFKTKYLPAKIYAKRFVIQKANIRKLVKDYDVIVAYGNISWLKYSLLPWVTKSKIVYHTLGVSASYTKGYDQCKKWDKIRSLFYKKASALAFYTDYPIEKYKRLGIPTERMFVAPNTVSVEPIESFQNKDSIIMIGTLYKEKGIQYLLEAYLALKDKKTLPKLFIIGGGPDYDRIKDWIKDNDMMNIISLEGPIYDIKQKSQYFARALACISPKQAGLTVLESMGYGVPFITTKDAITGGELLNIHNGQDGILMKSENDLLNVIEDIADNPKKYVEMGVKAKKFYYENRTIKHMADGLWKAIQYAQIH